MKEKQPIGGQAVIEGVMLRSKNYYVTSVRTEKGKIVSDIKKIKKKPKWMTLPFLRGIVNLIEMLIIGIKTLTWSADYVSDKKEEKLSKWQIALTLTLAIGFAVIFFVALPYFLSLATRITEEKSPILFNLVDGIFKIIIFVLYIYLISLMKDIQRVFQYHGAEHKVVYCYEENKELTVKNASKYSTKHPRCGTSFLFIVLIISIFFFALIPPIMLWIFPDFMSVPFILRKFILFALRISTIPIIAGISYELLKLSGKHGKHPLIKFFSSPGIWLQNITTKEPDKKQLEVALKSMEILLKKEKIS